MIDGWMEAVSATDFISMGILLTAISMGSLRRLESCLRAYTLNSWLLALLTADIALRAGEAHLYVASLLTVAGKGIIIPLFMRKIIRRTKVTHDVEPYVSNAVSLTVSGVLVAAVYASLSEGVFVTGLSEDVLRISVAVILVSLFMMMTRRKAITQVIGLLFMENGLFLAGFSLTSGMPVLIELGIFFDALMGVIILGIFSVQIKKAFASLDLDSLTLLKG